MSTEKKEKQLTYAAAVNRLNEIMKGMEDGTLDVDALTETLKEARMLLNFCKDRLHNIDKGLAELTEVH